MRESPGKRLLVVVRKELLTLLLLFFAGVLLLPIAIYVVGSDVFGSYIGGGFSKFYGEIHSDLRDGQNVAIFLLLSPTIIWQLMRLTFHLFRKMAPARHTSG